MEFSVSVDGKIAKKLTRPIGYMVIISLFLSITLQNKYPDLLPEFTSMALLITMLILMIIIGQRVLFSVAEDRIILRGGLNIKTHVLVSRIDKVVVLEKDIKYILISKQDPVGFWAHIRGFVPKIQIQRERKKVVLHFVLVNATENFSVTPKEAGAAEGIIGMLKVLGIPIEHAH